MNKLKVAGCCLNQTPLNWKQNLAHILQAIELAKSQKVAILCLPELAISGYGCEDAFFSDEVLERSLNHLAIIAEACQNIIVSVGLPLEFENCLYNVVCLICNQQILGFVAKQELAGDGIHYEPRWFKPWPKDLKASYSWKGTLYPIGDIIFEINGVRIGFEICEDAWNGVRPAQQHYLNNIDIILNPSASHFAFGKTIIREGLVREASRSYSCAYLYSNLLGNESGRVIYDGEIIIAQSGKLLARNERFSFEAVQLISAVIDIDTPRRQKKKLFSFKPELPNHLISFSTSMSSSIEALTPSNQLHINSNKLEEFYHAVTLGLWDYMRKSYSRGFVISLSGGADSSACAVLAAHSLDRALNTYGAEGFLKQIPYFKPQREIPLSKQLLTYVYQSTQNSSSQTLESAEALSYELNAEFINWSIEEVLEKYENIIEKNIGRALTWAEDDIAKQNIQARVRAPGVWMLANLQGALLLTTSNRSEAAVGYATMDGDTAGGLAPLGGIDKATLLEWLKWAEVNLGISALKYVNNLTPSAELRPLEYAQTDEDDLMPYPILDQIERSAIHQYKSPLQVFHSLRGITSDELLKQYIRRFFSLWARNQWKRERYAPSFHLDDANLDPRTWCRFPILNGGYLEELEELNKV